MSYINLIEINVLFNVYAIWYVPTIGTALLCEMEEQYPGMSLTKVGFHTVVSEHELHHNVVGRYKKEQRAKRLKDNARK